MRSFTHTQRIKSREIECWISSTHRLTSPHWTLWVTASRPSASRTEQEIPESTRIKEKKLLGELVKESACIVKYWCSVTGARLIDAKRNPLLNHRASLPMVRSRVHWRESMEGLRRREREGKRKRGQEVKRVRGMRVMIREGELPVFSPSSSSCPAEDCQWGRPES